MTTLNTDRRDYDSGNLNKQDVAANPLTQLSAWLNEAKSSGLVDYNAFSLSTIDADGFPQTRVLLVRELEQGLIFYSNYDSAKGREMDLQPKAGAHFFWSNLERQVRVVGHIRKVSTENSDAYFASRPRESQLAAWASAQSASVESRQALEAALSDMEKKFKDVPVPRPKHWGGYCLEVHAAEFWQGRPGRLHDRIKYTKNGSTWTLQRLQP